MKNLITLIVILTLCLQVKAQQEYCGLDHLLQEQAGNPQFEAWRMQLEALTQSIISENKINSASRNVINIPVVVHVLYCDEIPDANILTQRITSQLQVLNQDFNQLNPRINTTHPYYKSNAAANFEINFCLASKNPLGGPTNGIIRKRVPECNFTADLAAKWLTETDGSKQWDPLKYLNLYVVPDLGLGNLGISIVPGTTNDVNKDGPAVKYTAFGLDSENSNHNLGVAASHEIGHWMSLEHTFGVNPCDPDHVDDTPVQAGSQFDCPQGEVEGCKFISIIESGSGLRNVKITKDNDILFGTQSTGFRYKFGSFPTQTFLSDFQIRDIEIDKFGKVWVAAGKDGVNAAAGGAYLYSITTDGTSLQFEDFFSNSDGLNSRFINDIAVDENGDAWFASGQSLTAGDTDEGEGIFFEFPFATPVAFDCTPDADVRFLIVHRDTANQITYFGVDKSCLGTCSTPYIIKLQNGVCSILSLQDIADEISSTNFLIRGITTDMQGRVWVGFNSGIGIKVFDGSNSWRINSDNSFAFSVGEAINRNTMFTLSNNDIYVGAGNGLIIFHADSLQNSGDESDPELFTKIIPTSLHPSITSNSVTGADVRGDRLVFCTATQLIDAYRPYKHGTMTNNIMNYNKDECIALFTPGQKERARAMFDPVNGFRKDILTSNGCDPIQCGCPVTYVAKATNVTKNKATINWDANTCATSYKIFYRDMITGVEKIVSVNAPATSTILTGLNPGHDYEIQIKTFCSGSTPGNSNKSNIVKFLTLSSCETPVLSSAIFQAVNKLVVNWESVSGAVQYRIQYKKVGTDNWTTVAVNCGSCSSKNIISNAFESGASYVVRIRAKCSSNTFSPFSSEITINNTNREDELAPLEDSEVINDQLLIYPNPNNGRFNISIDNWEADNATLVITDLLGRVVYHENIQIESGIWEKEIVLDNMLSSGIYLIKLYSDSLSKYGKIVID
jgi:hypothetical protein